MALFVRKKLTNLIVYGLGQGINIVSPLLVVPYIVLTCGEANLGKIGVGFSIALIAIVLVDCGSYINGTKEIAVNSTDRDRLEEKFATVYLSKLLMLFAVLFVGLLAIFSIAWLRSDALNLSLSLAIVVGQFVNPTWFFQGIQDFKWITIINVISKLIYIFGVFGYVESASDFYLVNLFWGIGLLLSSAIGVWHIVRVYKFSVSGFNLKKSMRLIQSESSLTVSQLFFSLYQYAPILIVSLLFGDVMAGQFRVIDHVVMIFRTYLQMFFNFIYPEVCSQTFNDIKSGVAAWMRYNVFNGIAVLTAVVVFYFNAESVLAYFEVNFADNPNLVTYFKIALLIPLAMAVSFSLKQLLFALNKTKWYINMTIFSTMLSLLLLYVFLNLAGLPGAFLTTIAIELLISISYAWVIRNEVSKTKFDAEISR